MRRTTLVSSTIAALLLLWIGSQRLQPSLVTCIGRGLQKPAVEMSPSAAPPGPLPQAYTVSLAY